MLFRYFLDTAFLRTVSSLRVAAVGWGSGTPGTTSGTNAIPRLLQIRGSIGFLVPLLGVPGIPLTHGDFFDPMVAKRCQTSMQKRRNINPSIWVCVCVRVRMFSSHKKCLKPPLSMFFNNQEPQVGSCFPSIQKTISRKAVNTNAKPRLNHSNETTIPTHHFFGDTWNLTNLTGVGPWRRLPRRCAPNLQYFLLFCAVFFFCVQFSCWWLSFPPNTETNTRRTKKTVGFKFRIVF